MFLLYIVNNQKHGLALQQKRGQGPFLDKKTRRGVALDRKMEAWSIPLDQNIGTL